MSQSVEVPASMTPQRETRLLNLFQYIANAGADGLTGSEAARSVGLAPGRYPLALLDQMVLLGWVVKVWDESLYPSRYRYYLPEFAPQGLLLVEVVE